MIFEQYDRIVFAGDSVTDAGSTNPVGDGPNQLGNGYVHIVHALLASCYPELTVRVTNSGISGNTSRMLLERFQRDVVDLAPQWVSICIGINDVWRQFDLPAAREQHVLPEEYRSNVEQMITMISPKVKGVFLASPYYMVRDTAEPMRARMDEYTVICRELAQKHGCVFLDFQKVFDAYLALGSSYNVSYDRVHPNLTGAALMAREFLKAFGFDFLHDPKK